MSASELLLILLVAMLVFGPSKLPMLARHLGQLIKKLNYYKLKLNDFWQTQINEQQLQDNILKAKKADKEYDTKEDNAES